MIPVTSEPLTQKGSTARLNAENFCDVQDVEIDPTENGEIAKKSLRELKEEKGRSKTEEVRCTYVGKKKRAVMESKHKYAA